MKTITCRLSEPLDAQLEAVAREQGISKSDVVRNALEQQLGKKQGKRLQRAYDLVKDLAASVTGPSDLLSNPKHMEDFGA
jgi:Arc/MetJ-type ribon-helix-helix transcriptional regulator